MRLDEEAVRAGGEGAAGQQRCEFPLANRAVAARPRLLHRVRGVEDHRAARLLEHGDGAHVRHEVVVAEGRAALGDEQLFAAHQFGLLHHAAHLLRREELAFLQVHNFFGGHRRLDQIRLPAEEGGDLQDVHHLTGGERLHLVVNVRDDREVQLRAEALQDDEAVIQTRPAKGLPGSAVGFVVAGLEDIGDAQPRANLFQMPRDLEAKCLALNHTRSRQQKELPARRDLLPK